MQLKADENCNFSIKIIKNHSSLFYKMKDHRSNLSWVAVAQKLMSQRRIMLGVQDSAPHFSNIVVLNL